MRLPLLLVLAGCAASSTQLAKSPFTAEEIRGATQPGRTYVWRIDAEGQTFVRRLKFTEVDDTKATTEAINLAEDGTPMGEAEVKRTTWPEFVSHASWPKDSTAITEEKITVGAGEYDCMLYTVDEKKDGKNVRT